MGIGRNIKKIRIDRGITQRSLAEKLGITPAAVGNYERDVSFPKEDVLMKMFGALDCTPNELLAGLTAESGEKRAALFSGGRNIGERERALLNKYTDLDERGKAAVDDCAEHELCRMSAGDAPEEIAVAARNGRAGSGKLERRTGDNAVKSVLDLPDYKGGRR